MLHRANYVSAGVFGGTGKGGENCSAFGDRTVKRTAPQNSLPRLPQCETTRQCTTPLACHPLVEADYCNVRKDVRNLHRRSKLNPSSLSSPFLSASRELDGTQTKHSTTAMDWLRTEFHHRHRRQRTTERTAILTLSNGKRKRRFDQPSLR